jgi:shikimate dehydrogenase
MRKFGLIGYPLGHSFSADYFASKFERENIVGCEYSLYPIESINDLPELLDSDNELVGLNVTIPYKTQVLKYVDVVHESAQEIGAVNVLKIVREVDKRMIIGYNSDIAGVEGSLKPYMDRQIKNALILGTGGASKAVAFTLKKLGIKYRFVSIEGEENTLNYDELTGDILRSASLIVNTTPLGMYPKVDTKPLLDYDQLNPGHILFDVVYNPEVTAFLAEGKKRGCATIPGIIMFRLQAEQTWNYWNEPYKR